MRRRKKTHTKNTEFTNCGVLSGAGGVVGAIIAYLKDKLEIYIHINIYI